jgi:hypothetical protein
MIESEFQMLMMGELTFFLGIQVKQMKQDIFVHQAKYTKDLMKKLNMAELKPVSTPMSSAALLGLDEDVETVDQREYRSMIDSLLYLTATRSDIQFSRFSGISKTPLSLRFGILLLLHWILLAFPLLILWVVGLTERAPLGLVIFLDLLSFTGLFGNSLQLHSPPPRLSM